MKKLNLKTLIASLCIPACLLTGLASCKNNSDDDDSSSASPEVAPGTVGEFPEEVLKAAELAKRLDSADSHVILFWYDSSANYSDYTAYNWITAGDEDKMVAFSGDSTTNIAYADFTNAYASLTDEMKEALTANKDFNFIIREKSAWNKKTGDEVFPLSAGKHAIYTKGDIYTVSDNMKATISSATMETTTKMKVQLGVKYGLALSASDNGFKLTADDGSTIAVSDVVNYNAQNDRFKNNTSTLLVTLSSPINTSKEWTLSHEKFGKASVATAAVVSQDLANIVYTGDDLGLTLSGNKATFKVWAPTASDVKVLLYADVNAVGTYNASSVSLKVPGALTDSELKGTPADTIQMTKDSKTGVWTASKENCTEKYYKYQIVNGGKTYYVCDIYAKSASPDSIAAEIVDINSDSNAKPAGWESSYTNPFTGSKYNDAVIYEMHIRDWSRATNSSSTGKFKDFASDAVINHLKDLGVTHVQILPMFDYAQVNADENYNWGYNPYHYNVPEGRYTDYLTNSDGTAAVAQVREMVKKLHAAGIAVIMDVVFNHTSGTGAGSLYDSTVPYYYYRMKADGSYSNGSGCGNETNSEAPMFKKYMIDSLKHWMTDYHINGFRFDLMGLHSKDTMEEIGAELKKIDSKVLVYGEPWTGGDSLVSNSAGSAGQNFGAFDDDFRDAIKGAEFGGFKAGHVQGTFEDSGITAGLKGVSGKNKRNETGITGHGINYVECHDNFTLYDKLAYCLDLNETMTADSTGKIATVFPSTVSDSDLATIKKQDKLAAAFVLLGQGMPFLNGGQEFLRTKKGDPDSYAADTKGGITWTNTSGDHNIDDVNTIDLGFKTTYADVYNTYKGLIALRKSSNAFTSPTKVNAKKIDSKKGLTLYTVNDGTDSFEVYFNVTKENYALKSAANGKLVTISETDGSISIADNAENVPTIPAQSFVILKK